MEISVIIPAYNRPLELKRAVESVLGQTVPPGEIIVIDDGSEEDPGPALAPFGGRVTLVRRPHRGPAAARNTGIQAAAGQWLAFLDSDDWWLPQKLERQVAWHQDNPGFLISQTDEIWIRNGRRVNPRKYHLKPYGDIFYLSLERCLISPSTVMINRRLLREIGGFDEELAVCEDYDLWLRISSRYPVGLIEEKLVTKTGGHADQLSRKYWGMDRWRVKAIKNLLGRGVLSEKQRQAAVAEMDRKLTILKNGAEKRKGGA